MFYCEIYEIFKNNYFEEHLSTAASVLHSHHSLLLIRFILYSVPSSSSSESSHRELFCKKCVLKYVFVWDFEVFWIIQPQLRKRAVLLKVEPT